MTLVKNEKSSLRNIKKNEEVEVTIKLKIAKKEVIENTDAGPNELHSIIKTDKFVGNVKDAVILFNGKSSEHDLIVGVNIEAAENGIVEVDFLNYN